MKTINNRTTEYDIKDIFLERCSRRAMSGEAISKEELYTLFEAARWAPSAGNRQPWKFLYAMAGTPEFQQFFSFLTPFNQDWAKTASVLLILLSKNTKNDGTPNPTHTFETGAAYENLALQASQMNLITHAMGGIEKEKIRVEMQIPADYDIEIMIAVGKHGDPKNLPESLQNAENASERKPINEIVSEGKFID